MTYHELILSGKCYDAVAEGNLPHEDPDIRIAWDTAERRKRGFGWQYTVMVTDEQRFHILDYLSDLAVLERQIAGGAGKDADLALARAIEALLEREQKEEIGVRDD